MEAIGVKAGAGDGIQVKALPAVIHFNGENVIGDMDAYLYLLIGVGGIRMPYGVRHGLCQDHVQVVSEALPVAWWAANLTGHVFADVADQAEIACLIGDPDLNIDFTFHGFPAHVVYVPNNFRALHPWFEKYQKPGEAGLVRTWT